MKATHLNSDNRELVAVVDEPRQDTNDLLETCKDKDYPVIGYSDSVVMLNGGNMTQCRAIFYNGKIIGQEITHFPWNILKGVTLTLELNVNDDLSFGNDFYGKRIGISWVLDAYCIAFSDMQEFINFYTKHIQ